MTGSYTVTQIIEEADDRLFNSIVFYEQHLLHRYVLHCVPKKVDTKLMAVTLSFLNRFSKFFDSHTQW